MVLTIEDLIGDFFSHNEIIGLWVEQRDENRCQYHEQFWRGEAWRLPKKFLNCQFDKFFGTIPESIEQAGDLNICIKGISWDFRYDRELHEKFLRGEQEVREDVNRESCTDNTMDEGHKDRYQINDGTCQDHT